MEFVRNLFSQYQEDFKFIATGKIQVMMDNLLKIFSGNSRNWIVKPSPLMLILFFNYVIFSSCLVIVQ